MERTLSDSRRPTHRGRGAWLALAALGGAGCGSATPPVEVRTDSYVERTCACPDPRCLAEVERNSTADEHQLDEGEFERLKSCVERIAASLREAR